MNALIFVTLLLASPLPANAGDLLPVPLAVYCKLPFRGKPIAKAGGASLFKNQHETAGSLDLRQATKVREEYVQPAMTEACANPNTGGNGFIAAARDACQTGCSVVSDQWGAMVESKERATLRRHCEEGCTFGEAVLGGIGIGVEIGLDYKK